MSAFRDPFGAAARTLKTEVVVYICDRERRIKEGDCNGRSCTEWNCCSGTTSRKYAKNIGKEMRFVWDERAEALREVEPVHAHDISGEERGWHCEFKCSECGADIGCVECGSMDGADFHYCPNCGAILDREEEEE